MNRILALLTLLMPAAAAAAGYELWDFGMNRGAVSALSEFGPYYSFKNGDLGSQAGPYESVKVPISFYFEQDRLVRVMLIPYQGDDVSMARAAWAVACRHIQRIAGSIELPTIGLGSSSCEVALEQFDRDVPSLQAAGRLHLGAFPMPQDRRLWATVTKLENGQTMVSVNYGAQ